MRVHAPKFLFAIVLIAVTVILTVPVYASHGVSVAYGFSGTPGYRPGGGLVADSSGNLYGVTAFSNGGCGCGTVYELTPQAGGGWQLEVIHQFTASEGVQPLGLAIDAAGNLYGTTWEGGAYGFGTVFMLHPTASGWTGKVLHSFGSSTHDLLTPFATVTVDNAGNLYGTAGGGGTSAPLCAGGCGGVFELTRSGEQWTYSVIYNFMRQSDGAGPVSTLILDSAGNVYGTASLGGVSDLGTVFELSPSTSGEWMETTLYNFAGGDDGAAPEGGLVFDNAGNLYGTTSREGYFWDCNFSGCGTVFKLSPQPGGTWAEELLFSFYGSNGAAPAASLIIDSKGNLYGTAQIGGSGGEGVVFRLHDSGTRWTEAFESFYVWNGRSPSGPVLMQNGFLYGTASGGGKGTTSGEFGNGVVFDIRL